MKLSVTIITLNEESNIERAVRSAQFADEIIVLDSFSSDRTTILAKNLGAKIYQEKFLGFGAQKNRAAELAQGEWIFSLDADEEITLPLQQEILKCVAGEKNSLYFINRHNYFCGKKIKYGGWSPDWIARLYPKEKAHFDNPEVHETLMSLTPLKKVQLNGALLHFSFKNFESQVLTNLKYAKLGAKKLIKNKGRPQLALVLFRPFWKFIECYFIKKGFLDGVYGLLISFNASYSLYMKYSLAYLDKSDK